MSVVHCINGCDTVLMGGAHCEWACNHCMDGRDLVCEWVCLYEVSKCVSALSMGVSLSIVCVWVFVVNT